MTNTCAMNMSLLIFVSMVNCTEQYGVQTNNLMSWEGGKPFLLLINSWLQLPFAPLSSPLDQSSYYYYWNIRLTFPSLLGSKFAYFCIIPVHSCLYALSFILVCTIHLEFLKTGLFIIVLKELQGECWVQHFSSILHLNKKLQSLLKTWTVLTEKSNINHMG